MIVTDAGVKISSEISEHFEDDPDSPLEEAKAEARGDEGNSSLIS